LRVLLLNQVFYPDVVSVAQHLSDLAVDLSAARHEVTVLCSSRGYDNPRIKFPRTELWRGVKVRRVPVWGLGKKSKIRRIVGFATFFLSSFVSLMLTERQDVVLVTPPPPLLSVMAAFFVRVRGGRLVYWIMDLNPDEAIAAGWMKPDSTAARILGAALRYSLRASSSIVALDRFMKDRIVARGVPSDRIQVIPPWPHDQVVSYNAEGRESFRRRLGVGEKFVVMYSGNHSPLHPLDTILQCALRLQNDPKIAFVFVGGGSEFLRVKEFAKNLANVVCEPYQPLEQLADSLSAADLHVVLLGDSFVGIVHPCKIYNILAVGAPFLYIGPTESHIVDLQQYPGIARMGHFARHGDADQVVDIITKLASDFAPGKPSRPGRPTDLDRFSQTSLVPLMTRLVEAVEHAR